MSKKTTIKTALNVWEHEKIKMPQHTDIHPDHRVIQGIAKGYDVPGRDKWINHLANCIQCRDQWINTLQHDIQLDVFFDVISIKVAAAEDKFKDVIRISSSSGKCKLTFRRSLENADTCLITLEVLDESAGLEGRKIVVRDKNGRRLLYGRVLEGKLSDWIKGLSDVDLSFTSIVPEEGDNGES
jgi:hypothetical protein